jgi:hypothetical protein
MEIYRKIRLLTILDIERNTTEIPCDVCNNGRCSVVERVQHVGSSTFVTVTS